MAEEVYHKLNQIDAPKEKEDILYLVKESKMKLLKIHQMSKQFRKFSILSMIKREIT